MDSSNKSKPIRFVIAVFDGHIKDWTIRDERFDTEQEALDFINVFPMFGDPHSRAIRQGNWQIVKYVD